HAEPATAPPPKGPGRGTVLSVIGIVIGVAALGFALLLFNQSSGEINNATNSVGKIISAVGQISKNAARNADITADTSTLRAELVRTVSVLERLAEEHLGETETLQRIESIRKEALDIMETLGQTGVKNRESRS
ncbi:MAG: hypothetical protein V3S46_05690, partial [Nitrospinota bacterium]